MRVNNCINTHSLSTIKQFFSYIHSKYIVQLSFYLEDMYGTHRKPPIDVMLAPLIEINLTWILSHYAFVETLLDVDTAIYTT